MIAGEVAIDIKGIADYDPQGVYIVDIGAFKAKACLFIITIKCFAVYRLKISATKAKLVVVSIAIKKSICPFLSLTFCREWLIWR